jgi:hypothetical protein
MRPSLCQEGAWEALKSTQGLWITLEHKKIGAESSDPNRHSQPRLPGSVVGSASMPPTLFANKITEVNVPK